MVLDQRRHVLSAEGEEYKVILPQVMDISGQEGIRLEAELLEEGISELEVTLYPLYIARPEFFPRIKGRTAVAGTGKHLVEIPFGQFEYRQMAGAFLKYLDGISVKLLRGPSLAVGCVEADTMGDFTVRPRDGGCSKAGDGGEWVTYRLLLSNKSSGRKIVNVHQNFYGKITTMGKNVFLPVAVALTGIAFVLRVSRILTLSLGDSKIVKKISMSTKTIMTHHYAVIVFFNVILSLIHTHVHELPYFDEKWVSVLYKYPGPHDHVELFSLVYILLCLTVPIGGSSLFGTVKCRLADRKGSRVRT